VDLPVTWKDCLSKGTFKLGWQTEEWVYHVFAKGISLGVLASFQCSMHKDSPNCSMWIKLYLEEAKGLKEQDTYYTISAKEYAPNINTSKSSHQNVRANCQER
jgi:hypothetical protein